MAEPWVCMWCERGAHENCINRRDCECVHEAEVWVPPDRRAQLRTGAQPVDTVEDEFQQAYWAHRDDRREAADRRG